MIFHEMLSREKEKDSAVKTAESWESFLLTVKSSPDDSFVYVRIL